MKDLKLGEGIHTVFRAARKEKNTSRGGKSFLALTLVDRTGEIDGRVFENVGAADQAFSTDDYLLVKGKVGQFHGKPQVVVERLERLDPGPIEASEFAYTPAPPAPEKPAHEKPSHEKQREPREEPRMHLSRRLARLLENPQVAQALDQLAAQLEKAIEKQVEERHAKGGAPQQRADRPDRADRPERPERKPRGPRVEHKPDAPAKPAEPKRDLTLPEGLAFKPFNALVGEGEKPEASEAKQPESPESSPS